MAVEASGRTEAGAGLGLRIAGGDVQCISAKYLLACDRSDRAAPFVSVVRRSCRGAPCGTPCSLEPCVLMPY